MRDLAYTTQQRHLTRERRMKVIVNMILKKLKEIGSQ